MNKHVLIVLCSIIVVLLGIIAAGVVYLYHDVEPEQSYAVEYAAEPVEEPVVVTEPVAVEEPVVVTEPVAVAEPEAPTRPEPIAEVETEIKKTDISSGPFKVKNSGTGKDNIIRQNRDNSIELIDEKGKSLWKKQLSGKLGGMVGQVDYFHNGKIQYLMVEQDNVHLIDRLGREVASFPRKLPAKAIVGPDKIDVNGTNYWRVDTEQGTVYLSLKKNQILNQLPQ